MKHYQGDEFPVHIDLGKTPDVPTSPVDAAPTEKRGKPKPYYPTLYISDIEGLGDIPKEGCALIEFRRRNVSINTPEDGKPRASVDLEVHTLCLMESSGDDEKDLKDVLSKTAKEMGVDTGEAESDAEDADEEGEE